MAKAAANRWLGKRELAKSVVPDFLLNLEGSHLHFGVQSLCVLLIRQLVGDAKLVQKEI